jgi:SAM-dependent methyltransferase
MTMNLLDIVFRTENPIPWSEGKGYPYQDPDYAKKALEKLTDSRRLEAIKEEVDWIHRRVLAGRPTKILELCCGAGPHTSQLARLGHACVGIDLAPIFISYTADTARKEGLNCDYVEQDIRHADYGTGFGLVMLVGAEFNNFRPQDAKGILRKSYSALPDGGILLLDVGKFDAMKREGEKGPTFNPPWQATKSGMFSSQPHLCLRETLWDSDNHVYTERTFVIDAATGEVTRYASSAQAYTDEEYRSLLDECGFAEIAFFPSLTGEQPPDQYWMQYVIAAQKKPAA